MALAIANSAPASPATTHKAAARTAPTAGKETAARQENWGSVMESTFQNEPAETETEPETGAETPAGAPSLVQMLLQGAAAASAAAAGDRGKEDRGKEDGGQAASGARRAAHGQAAPGAASAEQTATDDAVPSRMASVPEAAREAGDGDTDKHKSGGELATGPDAAVALAPVVEPAAAVATTAPSESAAAAPAIALDPAHWTAVAPASPAPSAETTRPVTAAPVAAAAAPEPAASAPAPASRRFAEEPVLLAAQLRQTGAAGAEDTAAAEAQPAGPNTSAAPTATAVKSIPPPHLAAAAVAHEHRKEEPAESHPAAAAAAPAVVGAAAGHSGAGAAAPAHLTTSAPAPVEATAPIAPELAVQPIEAPRPAEGRSGMIDVRISAADLGIDPAGAAPPDLRVQVRQRGEEILLQVQGGGTDRVAAAAAPEAALSGLAESLRREGLEIEQFRLAPVGAVREPDNWLAPRTETAGGQSGQQNLSQQQQEQHERQQQQQQQRPGRGAVPNTRVFAELLNTPFQETPR